MKPLGAPENEGERKQQIDRALADLNAYIDDAFTTAVHFGVPRHVAAQQAKHMASACLRLKSLIEYQIPIDK